MKKNTRSCAICAGAFIGMLSGLLGSYITILMLREKMTLCEMLKCKTKDAFKQASDKFSL